MALAAKRDAGMSVAEYRRWVEPRPDDEHWELLDGEPVLMSPPSARHQRIVLNLAQHLDALAKPRGCGAYPGLAILSDAMDDYAPYPDVVVHCGALPSGALSAEVDAGSAAESASKQDSSGFIDDPLVIAEVLSPSTMTNDRGRKLTFYATVPSLQTLLIVYQDEARIEVWRRDAGWTMRVAGPDASIALPELGGTLSMAEIYDRTAL